MGLMARLERRNTRSDRHKASSRWLNTEAMHLWLRTRILSRFPTTPIQAVPRVAIPEIQ